MDKKNFDINIHKKLEKFNNEYVDKYLQEGPITTSELVVIRKEIESQILRLQNLIYSMIDSIIPYEIYLKSDYYLNHKNEIVKQLKKFFEVEDFLKYSDSVRILKVIQERFVNKISADQLKYIEGNLTDIVTISDSIYLLEVRKRALNMFIGRVIRNNPSQKVSYFSKTPGTEIESASKIPGPLSPYEKMYEYLVNDYGWNDEKKSKLLQELGSANAVSVNIQEELKEKFPFDKKYPDRKTLGEKLGLYKSSGRRTL